MIFAAWVSKLLSSEQPLTAHSSQLVSVPYSQIVQPRFDGLGASEAVQLHPKGALHSSVLSMGHTWPQRCPSLTDSPRGVSCIAVQENGNTFSGQVKEVVLYFPLHIIREQVLGPPSLPHCVTHTAVLRTNTFHNTVPYFLS